MKKLQFILFLALVALLSSCNKKEIKEDSVVLCIPVYGQSLALGEEAERITDFDSLAVFAHGRIVTENLDDQFGYFDNDDLKQWGKKMLQYQKRSYELSVYGMAEALASQLGNDTLICIFPGGQGATTLQHLSKGTEPYQKFLDDIKTAYETAKEHGCAFEVPAICWMQGESDIEDYPGTNYKSLLQKISRDLNQDIQQITGQKKDIRIICYQSNNVSGGEKYVQDSYNCIESQVPQSQMELIRDDSLFWPSGPTYPYTFARERIHFDGISQKRFGYLAALTANAIIHHETQKCGLYPIKAEASDNTIVIHFQVPVPPLQLDTINVNIAPHYGFGVITNDNRDILQSVSLEDNTIRLTCSEAIDQCKVRYAINGEKKKSGNLKGPRGNLRDAQGDHYQATIMGKAYPLHNWCYQFDFPISRE